MNGEERREKAVFTFKDTMKTVMRDTTVNLKSLQSRLHEVLLFNRVFNPCLMTKGHRYAKENNEESLVFTTEV